jgi:hypothetical protein
MDRITLSAQPRGQVVIVILGVGQARLDIPVAVIPLPAFEADLAQMNALTCGSRLGKRHREGSPEIKKTAQENGDKLLLLYRLNWMSIISHYGRMLPLDAL